MSDSRIGVHHDSVLSSAVLAFSVTSFATITKTVADSDTTVTRTEPVHERTKFDCAKNRANCDASNNANALPVIIEFRSCVDVGRVVSFSVT
jgi:hypothetical protein